MVADPRNFPRRSAAPVPSLDRPLPAVLQTLLGRRAVGRGDRRSVAPAPAPDRPRRVLYAGQPLLHAEAPGQEGQERQRTRLPPRQVPDHVIPSDERGA